MSLQLIIIVLKEHKVRRQRTTSMGIANLDQTMYSPSVSGH